MSVLRDETGALTEAGAKLPAAVAVGVAGFLAAASVLTLRFAPADHSDQTPNQITPDVPAVVVDITDLNGTPISGSSTDGPVEIHVVQCLPGERTDEPDCTATVLIAKKLGDIAQGDSVTIRT